MSDRCPRCDEPMDSAGHVAIAAVHAIGYTAVVRVDGRPFVCDNRSVDWRERCLEERAKREAAEAEVVRVKDWAATWTAEFGVARDAAIARAERAENANMDLVTSNDMLDSFADDLRAERDALEAELEKAHEEHELMRRVVEAARQECAKFRFPDEDRPGLHEALADLDAMKK